MGQDDEEETEVKGLSTEEAFERLINALTEKLEAHRAAVGRFYSINRLIYDNSCEII